MPITVSEIDQRLSAVLNDAEHVRWPLTERYDWINDGAGEIVLIRPQAGAKTETVALVAGVYQNIPEGGMQLLDVVRSVPGKAIRRTDRSLLDDQVPDWYDAKATTKLRHFMMDDRNPKAFYVYPPASAGAQVELLYSKKPDDISDLADVLDLDESYIGPLLSYVLYRAMAKDSEYANGAVAAAHFEAFRLAIGERNQTQAINSPKGPVDEAA